MINLKSLFYKKDNISNGLNIVEGNTNHIGTTPFTLKKMGEMIKKREQISEKELDKGYNLIKKYPRSVSILGSARFDENNIYYKRAQALAYKIVKELKYAVVTGGGPGIMEAASKGAFEAKGDSLGFTISLPLEQATSKYLTEYVECQYFFSRKMLLLFAAEAYVYFPGGFGTLNELFEIINLIQTGKITKAPVILVGKEFWTPFLDLFKQKLGVESKTISMSDTEIYKIVDSDDEIIDIIKKAPYREE